MNTKALPELAITYIRVGTTLLCSWPVSIRAANIDKIIFEIKWWFLSIMAMSVQLPMMYTAYIRRRDFMELTKFICFSASCGQGIIKMLICKRYCQLFEHLIAEMENFVEKANLNERAVLDRCVLQAGPIHVIFNLTGYLTSFALICGPLILDQPLPTEAEYPFSIEENPILTIIYCQQSFVILQCATVGPLDGQVCLLIWFTTARLEMLGNDVRKIKCINELSNCIRVHQHLLRYIDEVVEVARPIVVTTVIMATMAIIFGGIHVVGNEPFSVKVQFVGLDIGYSLQLFLSAWAAENLIKAVNDVQWAFYDSEWINNPNEINKMAVIFIQRLNKLPQIAISGVMPELNLNYYAVYLSKTFSFFTTLRVMLMKMEANDGKMTEIQQIQEN